MNYVLGVKSFQPVQNNQPVLDEIKTLDSRNKALSIELSSRYEYSTQETKKCDERADQFLFY